jgi:hypothetical protein
MLGRKRVIVYVDGFNLYYGVRSYGKAKWLDFSDLALPIEIVRTRFGRDVIVFNPHQGKGSKPSKKLRQVATQFRPPRKGPLCASQFPATLTDAQGTITEPKGW